MKDALFLSFCGFCLSITIVFIWWLIKHKKQEFKTVKHAEPEYYMNGKKAEIKPITKDDVITPDLYQQLFEETKMLISEMVEIDNPYIEDCDLYGERVDQRFTKCWVLRKELK